MLEETQVESLVTEAVNVLRVGDADNETSEYKTWERELNKPNVNLGEIKNATVTGFKLREKKDFQRVPTFRFAAQDMEIVQEIVVVFITEEGEKRELVLQGLKEAGGDRPPVAYRLIEKKEVVGTDGQEKFVNADPNQSCPTVWIHSSLSYADERIKPERQQLAQDMLRLITDSATEASK